MDERCVWIWVLMSQAADAGCAAAAYPVLLLRASRIELRGVALDQAASRRTRSADLTAGIR